MMGKIRLRNNAACVGELLAAVFLIVSVPDGWAASFQGLGDLPGGIHTSAARAVSADGSTVVGTAALSRWPININEL